jgi:hypothetical protein
MTKQSIRSSTEEIIGLSGRRTDAEPVGSLDRLGDSRSPRLRRVGFLGLLALSLLAWGVIIWFVVAWLR